MLRRAVAEPVPALSQSLRRADMPLPGRYVQSTWAIARTVSDIPGQRIRRGAERRDQAGALLREHGRQADAGLVIDPADGSALSPRLSAGQRVEFLPGLSVVGNRHADAVAAESFGFVVFVAMRTAAGPLRRSCAATDPAELPLVLITCVDRATLAECSRESVRPQRRSAVRHRGVRRIVREPRRSRSAPSRPQERSTITGTARARRRFTRRPFSPTRFRACISCAAWNRPIPSFTPALLRELRHDRSRPLALCMTLFRRLYSPSLANAIRTTGFRHGERPRRRAITSTSPAARSSTPSAAWRAVSAGTTRRAMPRKSNALGRRPIAEAEVAARLRTLTGLEHLLPAVSGATAVENALKLALVAQFPSGTSWP